MNPRPLRSLLVTLASLASLLGGCSSTASAPVLFPKSAVPIPASFVVPGAVPGNCAGQIYFAVATTTLCKELTYFLCNGSTYSEYDCTSPGAGWSVETLVPDPPASSSAPAASSRGASSSGSSN